MSQQGRENRKDFGQRRVLVVEGHIVVEHGGDASGYVDRLVECRRVGSTCGGDTKQENY